MAVDMVLSSENKTIMTDCGKCSRLRSNVVNHVQF